MPEPEDAPDETDVLGTDALEPDVLEPDAVEGDGRPARVDYGIDSWSAVVGLGFAAFGAGLVMVFAAIANAPGALIFGAFVVCALLTMAALVLVRSSRVGRIRERARLVDWLELPSDAFALDVGCGAGLVLVELALRVPEGFAVGIDVWDGSPTGADGPATPLVNARLEGVGDQVAVTTGEAASLPFATESFDAVTCSRLLGELDGAPARLDAVREMARVLVPGGRLVVLERHKTRALVIAMRSADLADVARSRRVWQLIPPPRYVTGVKPTS